MKKNLNSRKIIRLSGWLLVALITSVILMYFILLTSATMNALTQGEYNIWAISRIIRRTIQIDILFLLLVLSVCMSKNKKIVVLYLRKFRLNTNVLAPDNKGGLGNRIRIVTLQDQSFPSMASTRKDKLVTYSVTFVLFISVVLLIYYLAIVIDPVVSEGNYFLIMFGYFIIGYAMWLCITLAIFMFFYMIVQSVNKVIKIKRLKDIDTANNKVGSLALFIKRPSFLGSRSTVVETLNNLWKDTVSSLMNKCNVAIIDITQLTDNIKWEIKECFAKNIPIVLIYSEEIKSELPALINQLSLTLNEKSLVNIPLLEFPVENEKELGKFRNNLTKIITANYIQCRDKKVIRAYYLKRLLIYAGLFFLSIILASLITLIVGYNIFHVMT